MNAEITGNLCNVLGWNFNFGEWCKVVHFPQLLNEGEDWWIQEYDSYSQPLAHFGLLSEQGERNAVATYCD
jgi:hypothetical protein